MDFCDVSVADDNEYQGTEDESMVDDEDTISDEESQSVGQSDESQLLEEADAPLEDLLPPEYRDLLLSQVRTDDDESLSKPSAKRRRTRSRTVSTSHEATATSGSGDCDKICPLVSRRFCNCFYFSAKFDIGQRRKCRSRSGCQGIPRFVSNLSHRSLNPQVFLLLQIFWSENNWTVANRHFLSHFRQLTCFSVGKSEAMKLFWKNWDRKGILYPVPTWVY